MRKTADKIKKIFQEKGVLSTDACYHLSSLSNAPEMSAVLWEVKKAFEEGIDPERISNSTNDAHLLKDRDLNPLAIFKPDRKYCRSNTREVAAYRLDYKGFAGVPPTVFTTLTHPLFQGKEKGVCQLFIQDSKSLCEISLHPSVFSAAQVRRIAALDIRLLNSDRHSSNLLVRENSLLPIDHGICLPSSPFGAHFIWINWPQAKTPFSEKEKEYLLSLKPDEDEKMLDEMGIEKEAAFIHRVATAFLQEGIKRNLTVFQIGQVFIRKQTVIEEKKTWPPCFFSQTLQSVFQEGGRNEKCMLCIERLLNEACQY